MLHENMYRPISLFCAYRSITFSSAKILHNDTDVCFSTVMASLSVLLGKCTYPKWTVLMLNPGLCCGKPVTMSIMMCPVLVN
jgi:hypothetical protein